MATISYLQPRRDENINPVGTTLGKFKAVVLELQNTDPRRMAGDLDTISSGLLALHLVLDRVIAARADLRLDAE